MSTDEWCTPKWLAKLLGTFDLDPCSNYDSHIAAWSTCSLLENSNNMIAKDGLVHDWARASVFVNPPYSDVLPWAGRLSTHSGPWCALLKLDPTTKWWAVLMTANPTVAPFRKRIRFEGDKRHSANFPSVLVYKRWEPCDELRGHLWLPTFSTVATTPRSAVAP